MKLVTRSFAVLAAFVVATWIVSDLGLATSNRSFGDIRDQSRDINAARSLGHST
jgi:hypothetical protein